MEDVVMNGLVELKVNECVAIYGGVRDENVAQFVGFIAQCVGVLSKMVYLFMKRSHEAFLWKYGGNGVYSWR